VPLDLCGNRTNVLGTGPAKKAVMIGGVVEQLPVEQMSVTPEVDAEGELEVEPQLPNAT